VVFVHESGLQEGNFPMWIRPPSYAERLSLPPRMGPSDI